MKENKRLSDIIENTKLIMQDLCIGEVNELDSRLANLKPQRYIEERDKILNNVPEDRKEIIGKFLDNRRSVGLMEHSGG